MSIEVRFKPSAGRVFPGGSDHYTGADMVDHALRSARRLAEDEAARVTRLAEIVGRLLERLPGSEWIEVCGLKDELERVE